MGSDSFFAGIAKYLVKYEWGTAKTDNLWTELGQVVLRVTTSEDVILIFRQKLFFPICSCSF